MSLSREKSYLKFYKQRKVSGLGIPRNSEYKKKWFSGLCEYIALDMTRSITKEIIHTVLEDAIVVRRAQYEADLIQRCIEFEKEDKEPDKDIVARNQQALIFKEAEKGVERAKRELENAEDILSKAREAKEALE